MGKSNELYKDTPGHIVAEVTQAMRDCDILFETTGGGTRHYVRDLLLPTLKRAGYSVYSDEEIASLKYSAEVLKTIRPDAPTLKDMAD